LSSFDFAEFGRATEKQENSAQLLLTAPNLRGMPQQKI
jgi:hypothetical protein